MAFVVAAAHIVEHLVALVQVAGRKPLLDARLALQQPVHGRIELVFVRVFHLQQLRQGRAVPHPRRRQLRTGRDQPLDDHRQHQVALTGALGANQLVQTDPSDRLQHRFDVTVGPRTLNRERILRGDQRLVLEYPAQGSHLLCRPVGKVRQRTLAHFLALAPAFAQQDGGAGAPVRDDFDVHGNMYTTYALYCKRYMRHLHGNILTQVKGWFYIDNQGVAPDFGWIY